MFNLYFLNYLIGFNNFFKLKIYKHKINSNIYNKILIQYFTLKYEIKYMYYYIKLKLIKNKNINVIVEHMNY